VALVSIQIDHVVIAGKDLAALRKSYEAVGFATVDGGTHMDGHTHNALIPFADGSYLELITPTPGSTAPNHAWSAFMNADAGTCAWAIRSQDIAADAALFRQRGITVSEPIAGGRTRPDGVRLDWITARLGDGVLGSVLPFLSQDVTPREWRVPAPQNADTIWGVEQVLIGVRDLESSAALFEQAFDAENNRSYDNHGEAGSDPSIHLRGLPITLYAPKMDAMADRIAEVGESVHEVLIETGDMETALLDYQTMGDVRDWHGYAIVWFEDIYVMLIAETDALPAVPATVFANVTASVTTPVRQLDVAHARDWLTRRLTQPGAQTRVANLRTMCSEFAERSAAVMTDNELRRIWVDLSNGISDLPNESGTLNNAIYPEVLRAATRIAQQNGDAPGVRWVKLHSFFKLNGEKYSHLSQYIRAVALFDPANAPTVTAYRSVNASVLSAIGYAEPFTPWETLIQAGDSDAIAPPLRFVFDTIRHILPNADSYTRAVALELLPAYVKDHLKAQRSG